jgi:quercetin dioxygenase-like cupin family protein
MQLIKRSDVPVLQNSGVQSEQLLFPESSPDAKATITRVTIPAGATSPRHIHEASEQVWVALSGRGTLLLKGETEADIREGDVARFAPGDVHGFFNSSDAPFVYLSVTTPPQNFRGAYAKDWRPGSAKPQ